MIIFQSPIYIAISKSRSGTRKFFRSEDWNLKSGLSFSINNKIRKRRKSANVTSDNHVYVSYCRYK